VHEVAGPGPQQHVHLHGSGDRQGPFDESERRRQTAHLEGDAQFHPGRPGRPRDANPFDVGDGHLESRSTGAHPHHPARNGTADPPLVPDGSGEDADGVEFYAEQVRPRLLEVAMRHRALGAIRDRVCDGLTGDLLEIGYGTGLNHRHLPSTVRGVWAVEPSAAALRMAAPRRAATHTPVVDAGRDAQRMDLPDDRFDAVLSTFTLCGIPDPAAALAEVVRVLRPGAVFSFVEHGRAPDEDVRRWQRRLNPVNRRVNGCLLDRDIAALVTAAGLTVTALNSYYHPTFPRFLGYVYEGRAVVRT